MRAKKAVGRINYDNRRQAGINIAKAPAPARQISENAGVEGSIVVGKILENKSDTSVDAQTEEHVDMVDKGKTIRPRWCVLRCRTPSVAGLLVITEAMVAELPKEPAAPVPAVAAAWVERRHGVLEPRVSHQIEGRLRAAFFGDDKRHIPFW